MDLLRDIINANYTSSTGVLRHSLEEREINCTVQSLLTMLLPGTVGITDLVFDFSLLKTWSQLMEFEFN